VIFLKFLTIHCLAFSCSLPLNRGSVSRNRYVLPGSRKFISVTRPCGTSFLSDDWLIPTPPPVSTLCRSVCASRDSHQFTNSFAAFGFGGPSATTMQQVDPRASIQPWGDCSCLKVMGIPACISCTKVDPGSDEPGCKRTGYLPLASQVSSSLSSSVQPATFS